MKIYLTILGCGSSLGVPRADGYWGKCNKKNKKNYRSRCSLAVSRGKNVILIDTSPDLRSQLLVNKIKKDFGISVEIYGVRPLTADSLIHAASTFVPIQDELLLKVTR